MSEPIETGERALKMIDEFERNNLLPKVDGHYFCPECCALLVWQKETLRVDDYTAYPHCWKAFVVRRGWGVVFLEEVSPREAGARMGQTLRMYRFLAYILKCTVFMSFIQFVNRFAHRAWVRRLFRRWHWEQRDGKWMSSTLCLSKFKGVGWCEGAHVHVVDNAVTERVREYIDLEDRDQFADARRLWSELSIDERVCVLVAQEDRYE